MKSSTGTLASWLPTAKARLYADLLTITLSGGSVLRYHSSDALTISYGGNTFIRGPRIIGRGVKSKVGVQTDEVSIDLLVEANDTVSGISWQTFVSGGGLDGASILLERVLSKGPDFAAANQVGGYQRFSGRFTGIDACASTIVVILATSWMELLDAKVPWEVYQSPCRFALFSAGCGLNRATWTVTGTVGSGSTTSVINTNKTDATGYYDLGVIAFTSGPNSGLRRTIKSYVNASGAVTLISPLPAAPANGNTFTIYPGCDLTKATCGSKFSNVLNFGGQPYIPDPVMAV